MNDLKIMITGGSAVGVSQIAEVAIANDVAGLVTQLIIIIVTIVKLFKNQKNGI